MPLEASGVSFAYREGRRVLEGVSLSLTPGGFTGIVGPNGAGKSTLLRLMAGVLTPGAGRVRLNGRDVGSIPHRERARRVAYLSQRASVAFAFTVREYVALGRYAAGAGADAAAVERALARVSLSERSGDLFGALSAGQQQRAALARVLAQLDGPIQPASARVLLADEPVSAMDPRHAIEALALLSEVAASGAAVAVVLHDFNLAARFCRHALVLDEGGRVAAGGPSEQTLTPRVLEPVFGVRFRMVGDPADPPGRALIASRH
jgi:iron complex transport system ATP-binding protein